MKAINVVSSLPLQKLLYFNFFYAFVFAVAHVAMCVFKIVYMPSNLTTRIVLPILVSLWALVEIARLRLGYNGNLHEKVRPPLHRRLLPCTAPCAASDCACCPRCCAAGAGAVRLLAAHRAASSATGHLPVIRTAYGQDTTGHSRGHLHDHIPGAGAAV